MKQVTISIVIAVGILGGALIFTSRSSGSTVGGGSNVSTSLGKQVITISAKGGYAPRETRAEPNVPTVFVVKTNGTYDCSAALVIPALKFSRILPPSGEVSIDVPPQEPGSVIQGRCGMGMYGFTVRF